DDISGVGQTEAAHLICPEIPDEKRCHYVQPGVGHYGVFNGRRFRAEIVPRITDFILENDRHPQDSGLLRRIAEIIRPRERPIRRPDEPVAADRANAPAGGADDLTEIAGIGPKFATVLAERGIVSFRQIAEFTDTEIAELEEALGFKGRIARENWIEQAKKLAAEAVA
ncbi:MAG: polyhydroxyalkanoate depolymerase, partial [Hyphomicrobiales bacterium]|nr:polyhydroxyalkanoate depolymerase [Hyphomicrobiales bacterium]